MAGALRAARGRAAVAFASKSRGVLDLAWAGLRAVTAQLRAARQRAQARGRAANVALLRSTFGAWQDHTDHARARVGAAAALAVSRSSTLLPRVLCAWAAAAAAGREARRVTTTALLQHSARCARAARAHAFLAWLGVVEARKAREDELRRCIKRKKLAFGLFKQWYWQCFDEDVQATIRRLFHSTAPAAHSPQPSRPARGPRQAAQHGAAGFQAYGERREERSEAFAGTARTRMVTVHAAAAAAASRVGGEAGTARVLGPSFDAQLLRGVIAGGAAAEAGGAAGRVYSWVPMGSASSDEDGSEEEEELPRWPRGAAAVGGPPGGATAVRAAGVVSSAAEGSHGRAASFGAWALTAGAAGAATAMRDTALGQGLAARRTGVAAGVLRTSTLVSGAHVSVSASLEASRAAALQRLAPGPGPEPRATLRPAAPHGADVGGKAASAAAGRPQPTAAAVARGAADSSWAPREAQEAAAAPSAVRSRLLAAYGPRPPGGTGLVSALAPYMPSSSVRSGASASSGELPGVLPSWRQVGKRRGTGWTCLLPSPMTRPRMRSPARLASAALRAC